jgi:hypothetical protein
MADKSKRRLIAMLRTPGEDGHGTVYTFVGDSEREPAEFRRLSGCLMSLQ